MKALLAALLALAMCVERARALKCYTCENQASEDTCHTNTTCLPLDSNFCLTAVNVYPMLGTQISKRCAWVCVPSSITAGGVGTTTNCCSTDLCNGVGSATLGGSEITTIPSNGTTSSITSRTTTRAANGGATTNLGDVINGVNGAISLKISYIVLAATDCFIVLLFRGVV